MQEESKGLSAWRFVAFLITILLAVLVWKSPEILAVLLGVK